MHRFLQILIFAWLIVAPRCQPTADGGMDEPPTKPTPPTVPSKDPPNGGSPNTTDSSPTNPHPTLPSRPKPTGKRTRKPIRRACPYGYKWVGYKCTREVYHAVQHPGSFNKVLDLKYLITTSGPIRTKYFTLTSKTRWPNYHPEHPGHYATPPWYYDRFQDIYDDSVRRLDSGRTTASFGKWAVNAGNDDTPRPLRKPRYFDRRFEDFRGYQERRGPYMDYEERRRRYRDYEEQRGRFRDYEEQRRRYRDYEEQRRSYQEYKKHKSQYRTKKSRSKFQRRG